MIRLLLRAFGYMAFVAALTVFGGMCGFRYGGDIGAAIGGATGFILACLGTAQVNAVEAANSH